MTTELKLKSNSCLEFAYGRILPGEEKWMAEEYFGTMGPALAANGFERLVGAGVFATNVKDMAPVMAVFCAWPDAANRAVLQSDPQFIKIKPERDARLEMSDGHLFELIDEVIALNTDSDYAIVIAGEDTSLPEPIFSLPLSVDTHNQEFDGKSINLMPWSSSADALLSSDPTQATVFRVRFEPAG